MTQPPSYPPPGNPPPSYPPPTGYVDYSGGPPPRPSALTTAGVLGIVLASIGILWNLCQVGGSLLRGTMAHRLNQQVPPGWVSGIEGISGVVYLAMAVAWLVISIGVLRIASWSRGAGMKLASFHIALSVLWIGVMIILVAPEQKELAKRTLSRPSQGSNQMSAGTVDTLVTASLYGTYILMFVCGLIIPVTMGICLSRPTVKAALADTQTFPPSM